MECVGIMLQKEYGRICSTVNNIYPLFYYDLYVTRILIAVNVKIFVCFFSPLPIA